MSGGVSNTNIGTDRAINATGVNGKPELSRGPAIATHSPDIAAKLGASRGETKPAFAGNRAVNPEAVNNPTADAVRNGAALDKSNLLSALGVTTGANNASATQTENATTYEAPQLASSEEDTSAQDNQIAVNDPWGGAGATFA